MLDGHILDVRAMLARDGSTDDASSKIGDKTKVCKPKAITTEKGNNVGNDHKEMDKISLELVRLVKEVVFLLKCLICLVFVFGVALLARISPLIKFSD